MTTRSDSPGVWFPPPLWYVLAVLIGIWLNRRMPLPIATGSITTIAGVIFITSGVTLAFLSVGLFRRSKTSLVPIRSADTLVVYGPYRYTRNPMYVSLALITIGCGLLLATWWPFVLLVPTLGIVRRFVIRPE